MWVFRVLLTCLFVVCAARAGAQAPQAPAPTEDPLSRVLSNVQGKQDCSGNHCRLTDLVEIDLGMMTKFNADVVDLYVDPDLRIVASGNVTFTTPEGKISGDRVEFNVTKGTGIFHNAYATLSLGPNADRAEFGNQDPEVMFWGDTIEKVDTDTYRLTNGIFTTCVQPTPRWEIVSDTITVNLNDYAVATNMLLRVKGVPLLYLPVMYYPIREEGRATGFLMPTYGTSTLRGQALSNAFFWAINRSQDMTLYHDWFTKAGQGAGVEYRYVNAPGSYGNFNLYRFQQRAAQLSSAGAVQTLPALTSYQFLGSANQVVGQNVRVYERVDYTSDLSTKQLYQQNIYQASNASSTIEAGLSGWWGGLSTSALYQRTETFSGTGNSVLYGSTPRLTASLAPARLGTAAMYLSMNSEYAYLPNRQFTDDTVTSNQSVGRFDLQPRIQAAVSRLSFLSVNASASYRVTHYDRGATSAQGVLRKYLSLRTDAIGPVFSKVWDTPGSGFSERMKHVIEPTFSVEYITDIPNLATIPRVVDSSDRIVGGLTRLTYGINNRFLYRARTADGTAGSALEFLTVGVQQTYYSNALASLVDTQYVSASLHRQPVDLSNVALSARLSPTPALSASSRLEFDVHGRGLQVITSGINTNGPGGSASLSFSRTVLEPNQGLTGSATVSSLNGSTALRLLDGRMTGGYGLTWDVSRGKVLSQTIGATYLAQCCGIQMEFQRYQLPVARTLFPVVSDRRFNVSVVLAGLGTFSNFFGAFDGLVGTGR